MATKSKHPKKSHKEPKEEKKEEELIEEGLQAIYGDEKEVDFTKMDRGRGRFTSILLTIVVTLAVIALIGWGAFFVYNEYFTQQEEETFSVEIDVREELVSGEETSIAIRYQNPTDVPVTALELDVRLPSTFMISNLSPSPADEDELIWSVGSLPAGSDGVIVIDGVWAAEVPSSTPVQVLVNYRPANFNADFQEIETVYIQTLDSTFDLEFEGPEEAVPGESLEYRMRMKNTGTTVMEDVEFQLNLPPGFFLEESTPEVEPGAAPVWKYEEIPAGGEEEITFEGSFAADATGFQYFDMVTAILHADQSLTQATAQGFTDVLGSDLNVQLIVNGGIEDVSTSLGDNLRVTVAYENTGEADLENVSLLLDFQSELPLPIIWDEAELDGGRITADGILWDEFNIGSLAPEDRTLLNLIFPISSSIGSGQADQFAIVANASHGDIEVRSTPIAVVINSEAELQVSGRYYTDDGAPLGNGPMPPEVGSETTYRIFWTIENTLHDLENVEVSATLPPDVSWELQTAAELGSISFDQASNTVTWSITNLPASITRVQANFAVSVTPDEDDVGAFMKLTSGSILKATDVSTNAQLESSSDSVTTELEGDEFAEDRGVVVE